MILFSLNYLLNDSISRCSHVLRYWGLRLRHTHLGGGAYDTTPNSREHRKATLWIFFSQKPCYVPLKKGGVLSPHDTPGTVLVLHRHNLISPHSHRLTELVLCLTGKKTEILSTCSRSHSGQMERLELEPRFPDPVPTQSTVSREYLLFVLMASKPCDLNNC